MQKDHLEKTQSQKQDPPKSFKIVFLSKSSFNNHDRNESRK